MRIDRVLLFLFCNLVIFSCTRVLHTSDVATQINNHKLVAVLPPITSIASMEGGEYIAYKNQMEIESASFQQKLVTWFHIAKDQGKITVDIQDLLMTNDKLKEIGYFDGVAMTVTEVCEALEVDGLLCSYFGMDRPNTSPELMQIGALEKKHKNDVEVNLELFDGISKKVIWKYSQKLGVQQSFTNDLIAESLMRSAIKKMPYNIDLKLKEEDENKDILVGKDLEF